ncbi:MAG TPA: N-acetylmuramoyl-L-alanine amidase [Candidatus Acidoferrales bacterium]|jgi:N-acetylmuramoyl-L-alanine amidase|nr:N-acetylmuramoyl-L-alanine amidase [Candidatus Acidoferrales bacterium]
MLFAVRNLVFLIGLLLLPIANVSTASQQSQAAPASQAALPAQSASPSNGNTPPQPLQQSAPAPPPYNGPTIVINPAHGGTDSGARGQDGIVEKDIVLQFARVARAELVRQGYKVVLTRDDDSNPSYDDRAAVANGYRDAIFVSLHIASTGAPGTVRVYYYQFWKQLPPASPTANSDATASSGPVMLTTPLSATTLVPWNEAQRAYQGASQQLANQLQAQMASAFSGSPQMCAGVEVRGLRSVASPAVAIEVSSVAVNDAKSLTVLAGPLAAAIGKSMQSFRPLNATGVK